MKAIKRRRLGEHGWGELMWRYEAAGQPMREFCQREGVSVASFHRWRARLVPEVGAASARPPALRASAAQFVDLGTVAGHGTLGPAGAALELRIELGGGVVLQLVRR
jgi:hypothetical protein